MRGAPRQIVGGHRCDVCFACRRRLPIAIGDSAVVRSVPSIQNSVGRTTPRNAQASRRDLGIAWQWKDDPGSPIGARPQPGPHRQRRHLDRLFESKGVGNAAWRRTLSRESDEILQHEATSSNGAILASFWRSPGMPSDSGTPTDWLDAPSHHVVNVHCACALEVAASRFLQRRRHPRAPRRRIVRRRSLGEPSTAHGTAAARHRPADRRRYVPRTQPDRCRSRDSRRTGTAYVTTERVASSV